MILCHQEQVEYDSLGSPEMEPLSHLLRLIGKLEVKVHQAVRVADVLPLGNAVA